MIIDCFLNLTCHCNLKKIDFPMTGTWPTKVRAFLSCQNYVVAPSKSKKCERNTPLKFKSWEWYSPKKLLVPSWPFKKGINLQLQSTRWKFFQLKKSNWLHNYKLSFPLETTKVLFLRSQFCTLIKFLNVNNLVTQRFGQKD